MSRKERRAAQKQGGATASGSAGNQVQSLFAAAVGQHQAGQLADAERLYRSVLAAAPEHAQSLYYLGILALQQNRPQAGIDWLARAVAREPGIAEWHYNLGFAYQSVGRFDDAALCYGRAAALDPFDPKVQTNLGNVLTQQGRLADAAQCHRRVLELAGASAQAHANLANVLARQESWAEAAAHYEQALALAPHAAPILTNSAIVLAALGRRDDADARHARAVALDPSLIEARMNFGAALRSRRRFDEAATQYKAVVRLRPDHAEAHDNLGIALMATNDLRGAIPHFERAAALLPARVSFLNNLARAYLAAGDTAPALATLMRALSIESGEDTRRLVVWALSGLSDFPRTRELRDVVLRAVTESWGRIDDFSNVAAGLVALNPAVAAATERAVAAWPRRPAAHELLGDGLPEIAQDALLRGLLKTCPVATVSFERFLTTLRSVILGWAEGDPPAETELPHAIEIGAVLAQQCFINEYIFALTDDEVAQLHRLRERLAAAIATDANVPPLWIVAVAAYEPLYRMPGSEQLLAQSVPAAVRRVLRQQIEEPQREAAIAAAMPPLTAIDDDVSIEVRQQYEQNPYPRWVKPVPPLPPIGFSAFLREQFPLAALGDLPSDSGLDILIAGSGTGQHPIETARQFTGARVLAVDLSRASLAYAQRKSEELGLAQIAYAQADILNLGTLDRRFDLVESFGVLHHMADPWRGWRVLVSLLRPGGVMNIGLYSELARQDVVQARAFIAAGQYGGSPEEIRRFRQDVFALEDTHPLRALALRRDLFSTSNCRDLLFHVQEHRMTLPQIKSFLAETDLQFLGFMLDSRLKRLYAQRFPDDPAMIDLDNWHTFETEYPKTFVNLYQLWVQKRV